MKRIPIFVAMEEEIQPYLDIIDKKRFNVIVTGIGKVNAAAAAASVGTCKVAINIGIVGGVNPKLKVNDVVIVEKFCQHDIDITPLGYARGQLPGHDVYVNARIPVIGLPRVVCSSSDAFITNPNLPVPADIVDMESAAIAQVLHKHGGKLISIKIVSDIVGASDNAQQYKFNKAEAVGMAKKYVKEILNGKFQN
jgi:adenosylhomocysteine nucleosidase